MQQSHNVFTQDSDDRGTKTEIPQTPSSPDAIAQVDSEQKSTSNSIENHSNESKEGNDNAKQIDISNKSPEERQSLLFRRKNEILKNARRYINGYLKKYLVDLFLYLLIV